ncbi:hypothetical protein [Streptomyces sp. NPDC056468]|uniref:hypothetical protein n=1 Tax=Streptomyces sp. NPDC056468 TaxID=3345830 RepID=UPI003684627C
MVGPDGWPIWVSPGREHDTTCARAHGLVNALNRLAATPGHPHPDRSRLREHRRRLPPPGQEAQGRRTGRRTEGVNAVIRGVHGVAERANAVLKVTSKALRRVSLDPSANTRIARAALVVLQLEHGRTANEDHNGQETLPRRVQ